MGKEEGAPAVQGEFSRVTAAICEGSGGVWGSELGQSYSGLPFLVMNLHPSFLLLSVSFPVPVIKILLQKKFKEEEVYLTSNSLLKSNVGRKP